MSRSTQGHQGRHRGLKKEFFSELYSEACRVCIIGQARKIRVEFGSILKIFFAWP